MSGVVCGHCGTANADGLRFCTNCDGFLEWDEASARVGPAPLPLPPVTTGSPPDAAGSPNPTLRLRPDEAAKAATSPAARQRPQEPTFRSVLSSPVHPTRPAEPPTRSVHPTRPPEPPRPPARAQGPQSTARLPIAPADPAVLTCDSCGAGNEPTRRFCRHCGQWLVTPSRTRSGGPEPLRAQLRRRWGRRTAYSSKLSGVTIAFRFAAAIVSLVVVTVALTLVGFHPIQSLTDQIGHIRGSGRVDQVSAVTQPAELGLDISAPWAVDDIRGRAWSTHWIAATRGDPKTACRAPAPTAGTAGTAGTDTAAANGTGAAAAALVLTFPTLIDVREIGVEPGLALAPERATRWQPRTLELHWDGGRCQVVQLANKPELQRFAVHEGEVSGVRIVIVAGFPPPPPRPAATIAPTSAKSPSGAAASRPLPPGSVAPAWRVGSLSAPIGPGAQSVCRGRGNATSWLIAVLARDSRLWNLLLAGWGGLVLIMVSNI